MFVPLAHSPGHAQADFGEADNPTERFRETTKKARALDIQFTDITSSTGADLNISLRARNKCS
jgi:hypothetical protein